MLASRGGFVTLNLAHRAALKWSKFGSKYDNAIKEMIYMLPPGW
jgi:hypothetical protein